MSDDAGGIIVKRYKCTLDNLIIHGSCLREDGNCPLCGNSVEEICWQDHPCRCAEDLHGGIIYCQYCGMPVCPCGSHDVVVLSRVTGYYQDLSGFNEAKKQEVRDRHHWTLGEK